MRSRTSRYLKADPENLVKGLSFITFTIAGLVLLGWFLNIPLLKSVAPGFISMKVNTAIGFALLAATNFLLRSSARQPTSIRRRVAALTLSSVALMIGILTIIEYRFNVDLKIDQLFFMDTNGIIGKSAPGRLAPITAVLLITIGSAQFLVFNGRRFFDRTAQLMTLFALVVAFQALLSYVMGVTHTFGYAYYTQIAVHTTLLVILVSAGLLCCRLDYGWLQTLTSGSEAGKMAKNLLICAIAVPPVIHWLQLTGERLELYNQDFSPIILVTGNMLFFVTMVFWNAVALHASDKGKRESEKKFQAVIELSPQVIWTADLDGNADYFNERWSLLTGLSTEESRGLKWSSALHPEDLDQALSAWSKSHQTGTVYEMEHRFKSSVDDCYRWHLGRAVPIKDIKGQIEKWYGSFTDIEDQKKSQLAKAQLDAEKHAAIAVQSSEARLRAIFDAAFDAIVGMNSEGMISDWNPQAEVMFGWTANEALGQSMSQMIIPEEHRANHERGLKHFRRSGIGPVLNKTIEVEAIRKGGERFPIELSITPIKTNDDFLFTAFIADITARKTNERELVAAKQEALDAAQAKSAFLANMSHEIRTPLNGIIGMTDLLLDTQLDAQQKKFATIVQDSGSGLLTIINDILDFSKIDAGKLTLEILEFSPVTLIESQAELLASKALEKGLTIITFADPALPKMLKGDPGRIGQVLLNLISNAIKFTAQGRVYIKASLIQVHDNNAVVEFSVEDTGIGLSTEEAQRLFKPFVQADGSTARKYGGTGLGLSICKQLVELMGGKIDIESGRQTGSRFSFQIPLLISNLSSESNDSTQHQITLNAHATLGSEGGASLDVNLEEIRVLVVDDDPIACEVTSLYLKSWKIKVVDCADGETALRLLRQADTIGEPFDLAIIDKRMPLMDGFALAKAIRNESSPNISSMTMILASAFDRQSQGANAREEGFSDYLIKPIKQSELYNSLWSALKRKREPLLESIKPIEPQVISSSPYRILVAEDNAINQLLTLAQLKKLGFAANAVANGHEVLQAYSTGRYDLILMDCQMPEMDGLEATRKIRELEAAAGFAPIPIIALTANAMTEDRDQCLAAGMNDFVTKPTKMSILAEAISRHLVTKESSSADQAS